MFPYYRSFITVLTICIIGSCTKSPETAKKELADIEIKYSSENFKHAVKGWDYAIVELFLEAGMSPDSHNVLQIVVAERNYDMVKLLLKHGANPNLGWGLIRAISYWDLDYVKLLVKNGAIVNQFHTITWKNDVALPLSYALDRRRYDIAKYLVQKGGTLNGWNNEEGVPLKDIYITDELKEKDYELWSMLKIQ